MSLSPLRVTASLAGALVADIITGDAPFKAKKIVGHS
jgi:hypothetical protein